MDTTTRTATWEDYADAYVAACAAGDMYRADRLYMRLTDRFGTRRALAMVRMAREVAAAV